MSALDRLRQIAKCHSDERYAFSVLRDLQLALDAIDKAIIVDQSGGDEMDAALHELSRALMPLCMVRP
jgi:hypothetical protein